MKEKSKSLLQPVINLQLMTKDGQQQMVTKRSQLVMGHHLPLMLLGQMRKSPPTYSWPGRCWSYLVCYTSGKGGEMG